MDVGGLSIGLVLGGGLSEARLPPVNMRINRRSKEGLSSDYQPSGVREEQRVWTRCIGMDESGVQFPVVGCSFSDYGRVLLLWDSLLGGR